MTFEKSLQDRIDAAHGVLSDRLQAAARYVADNPLDMATRSLRAVAASAGVSAATLSRLARSLGYDDYEQMREDGRRAVEQKLSPFSGRAHALRTKTETGSAMLHHQAAACIANIEALEAGLNAAQLERAVVALHNAHKVVLVGSLGSSGAIDYMGYMAQWFSPNWTIAGRQGAGLATLLSRLGPHDALLVLSKQPYARRSIAALETARRVGAHTIAITDARTSPALQLADDGFVVPSDGPQFFSSYAATLVLMETIVSMLLTRAGPGAEEMIRAAEIQKERLGENWAP